MTLPIEKMLVLSTSHITKEVAKELDHLVAELARVATSPAVCAECTVAVLHDADWVPSWTRAEGWMFYVPSADAQDTRYANAPYCLQTCVNFAREVGCSWLMLDRDGTVVSGLPTWEW